MEKRVWALRGATQIEEDSKEAIERGVKEMIAQLLKNNNLKVNDLISIQFTITDDLSSFNPATALRNTIKEINNVPLFYMQEPKIENSLNKTIRVLIYLYESHNFKAKHLYLGGAANLRRDLK
jgi:chorismate mutase